MVQEDRAEYGDAQGPAELLNGVEQPRRGTGLLRFDAAERLGEERRREQTDPGTADPQRGDRPQPGPGESEQQDPEADVHQSRAESLDEPLAGTPRGDAGNRRPGQQNQARAQNGVVQRELLVQDNDQGQSAQHREEQCRGDQSRPESASLEQTQLDQTTTRPALLQHAST